MSQSLIAFVSGVAQSVVENTYDEEYRIEVKEHPNESPTVHAWHTAGRLVGGTIKALFTGS